MGKASGKNRRKRKRAAFVKDVLVDGELAFRCSEISTGGMFLDTTSPLTEGSMLNLSFKPKDTDDNPVQVSALVMYIHDGKGMGVAFADLSEGDRERLERLLEKL